MPLQNPLYLKVLWMESGVMWTGSAISTVTVNPADAKKFTTEPQPSVYATIGPRPESQGGALAFLHDWYTMTTVDGMRCALLENPDQPCGTQHFVYGSNDLPKSLKLRKKVEKSD
eukprot:TRINITY_DN44957_c0_g1_i1.p1 TRINITY_DN44957_c0_g1~~TRINITY_DN44957_c0_g1_i1.p1  ORF type:complete len:115 (+),score=9.26 TRINITY_DN44957_c0_g1_i1:106-450(+)